MVTLLKERNRSERSAQQIHRPHKRMDTISIRHVLQSNFYQPDTRNSEGIRTVTKEQTQEVILMNTKGIDYAALIIGIIGAINWGLIGFFRFDLVAFLFGSMTLLTRIIYAVVGIAGLYMISLCGRIRSAGDAD